MRKYSHTLSFYNFKINPGRFYKIYDNISRTILKNAILNLEVVFKCRANTPKKFCFFGTVVIREAFEESKEPLDFQNKQSFY